MDFHEWEKNVPVQIRNDALWTVKVYKLSLYASDLAWHDVTKISSDKRTVAFQISYFDLWDRSVQMSQRDTHAVVAKIEHNFTNTRLDQAEKQGIGTTRQGTF